MSDPFEAIFKNTAERKRLENEKKVDEERQRQKRNNDDKEFAKAIAAISPEIQRSLVRFGYALGYENKQCAELLRVIGNSFWFRDDFYIQIERDSDYPVRISGFSVGYRKHSHHSPRSDSDDGDDYNDIKVATLKTSSVQGDFESALAQAYEQQAGVRK